VCVCVCVCEGGRHDFSCVGIVYQVYSLGSRSGVLRTKVCPNYPLVALRTKVCPNYPPVVLRTKVCPILL